MSNPDEAPGTKRPWMPFLLVLLPTWLLASAGWAIWHYFHQQDKRSAQLDYAFSRMVSEASLADDVSKITTVIGERHGSSDTAAKALDQMSSMIAGSLGPSNTGLEIRRYTTSTRWPILVATIPGSRPKDPALWLAATYDSRPGSPGIEANASGVAATMATAQQLAGEPLPRTIHFAFLPHGNDPDSPILETATLFANLSSDAYAILCIEAMASGNDLWLTSRDANSPLIPLLGELGSVRSAEVVCLQEDTDLASILFELGRPAIRIATRAQLAPDEADNSPLRPTLLATSTGRLITFLRRIRE
jgi:hypothetical protein